MLGVSAAEATLRPGLLLHNLEPGMSALDAETRRMRWTMLSRACALVAYGLSAPHDQIWWALGAAAATLAAEGR